MGGVMGKVEPTQGWGARLGDLRERAELMGEVGAATGPCGRRSVSIEAPVEVRARFTPSRSGRC